MVKRCDGRKNWRKYPGLKGVVYVPDQTERFSKKQCPDCHHCQMCTNDRCRLCLGGNFAGVKRDDHKESH